MMVRQTLRRVKDFGAYNIMVVQLEMRREKRIGQQTKSGLKGVAKQQQKKDFRTSNSVKINTTNADIISIIIISIISISINTANLMTT